MKVLIAFVFLMVSSNLLADSKKEAEMQKQIEALQAQMAELQQQNQQKGGGLKVTDMKNKKMDSSRSPAGEAPAQPQLTPEQMKKLQDSLKKGQEYLEERNQYIEELMNE